MGRDFRVAKTADIMTKALLAERESYKALGVSTTGAKTEESSKEKTMTVKEVAAALKVTERTIQRYVRKLPTELSGVKNNQGGYLFNEKDITLIKLTLEKNQYLGKNSQLPKTKLEKHLLIKQAMLLQDEIIEEQQREIEELKPKAEFFDQVTNSKDAVDMGSASKVLNMGIGRNKLFELLRNKKILMDNNQPYQKYIDSGYFRLIEQKYIKPDGSTHINIKTVVYQKGLNYIRKRLEENR